MESGGASYKEYQNIPPLIGILIAQHLATLAELRTVYSLKDALDIYEAFMIPQYNQYIACERLQKNRKQKL